MTPVQIQAMEICIPSDLAEARALQADIEAALVDARYGEQEVFAIKLALEEALVNAIKHGNRLDPQKRVRICYAVGDERFEIRIMDEGAGFDPESVPDPTALENLEKPCGRGLLLIRHYMSEVAFSNGGRELRMFKLRNGRH